MAVNHAGRWLITLVIILCAFAYKPGESLHINYNNKYSFIYVVVIASDFYLATIDECSNTKKLNLLKISYI